MPKIKLCTTNEKFYPKKLEVKFPLNLAFWRIIIILDQFNSDVSVLLINNNDTFSTQSGQVREVASATSLACVANNQQNKSEKKNKRK